MMVNSASHLPHGGGFRASGDRGSFVIMDDLPDHGPPNEWRQWTPPVAITAAVGAYFVQPQLRFMSAWSLETLAAGFGICIVGVYASLLRTNNRGSRIGWSLLSFVAFVFLMNRLDASEAESQINDRRCLAIQKDMLSARPRRLDAPDLFQALGCRPQGEGSVYASPAGRSRG